MNLPTRRCATCGKDKPLALYRLEDRGPNRKTVRCFECRRAKRKKRQPKQPAWWNQHFRDEAKS